MLTTGTDSALPDAIELVEQTIDGHRRFHSLKTAIDLGVLAWLAEFGPASPQMIATQLTLNQQWIEPFLQTLVDAGFVEKIGHRLTLSKVSKRLFSAGSGHDSARLLARVGEAASQWEQLPTLMKPAAQTSAADMPMLHSRAESSSCAELEAAQKAVQAWSGFKAAKRMLNLGGTNASLAIALCKVNTRLHADVLVAGTAMRTVRRCVREAGLSERVKLVQGDVFSTALESDYDIVLAVHCLYAFPKRILGATEKIAAAMRPQGLLLSHHWFEDWQDWSSANAARELERGIKGGIRPLRYPQAFADRVTSAGFDALPTKDVKIDAHAMQLYVAQ